MRKDMIGEADGPTDIFVTSNINGQSIVLIAGVFLLAIGITVCLVRKKSKK